LRRAEGGAPRDDNNLSGTASASVRGRKRNRSPPPPPAPVPFTKAARDECDDADAPSTVASAVDPLPGTEPLWLGGYGAGSTQLRALASALQADKVSLPDPNGPPPVDMLGLLGQEARLLYESERGGIVKDPPPPAADLPASFNNISADQYERLLQRMHGAGMLRYLLAVKVQVGVFAVPKGEDEHRLIVDGKRSNALFERPARVDLPGPEHLAGLRVPARESAHGSAAPLMAASKLDVRDCFHRLVMPEWLSAYFGLQPLPAGRLCALLGVEGPAQLGLPASTGAHTLVYPACRTVVMGFSHSCAIVQEIMARLAHRAGFQPDHSVVDPQTARDLRIGVPLVCGFYDDWVCISLADDTSVAVLGERHARLKEEWARAGMHHKPSKEGPPQVGGHLEALGLDFDLDRAVLQVDPRRRSQLVHRTLGLATQRQPRLLDMLSLLGHWIWALRVCRPALSVLRSAFAWVAAAARAADKFRHVHQPGGVRGGGWGGLGAAVYAVGRGVHGCLAIHFFPSARSRRYYIDALPSCFVSVRTLY